MAVVLGVAACGSSGGSGASTSGGVTTITMWTHNGGNTAELTVDKQIIADFNASQSKYKVELQAFPQESYNNAVVAAATAKKLPCILDIDAPNVPNWAWSGYLAPLDMTAADFANQLPSTVGKVGDKYYAFGHYDVALATFARKSALEAAGARIPTVEQPWTLAEFNATLAKIKAAGKFKNALDLGTGGGGEWIPYGYSPMLQSFGGDLINRDGYKSAEGVLNGAPAIAWATWFRSLVTDGYMAQKSGTDSTADFVNGKSAIVYTGSWAAATVSSSKIAADVLALPVPDFGNGPKIGGGSWQWGMTTGCTDKAAATAYLKFSLQTKYVVLLAKTLGLIPATSDAAAQLPDFAAGGKYEIYYQFAKKFAEVRPVTPAYPFISTTFQKASQDILAGGDPKTILDKAVKDIDNNISTNGGYTF
jgi:multiple sugar transport system substrate-binding protein